MNFNHFNSSGEAVMVDVSAKEPTLRRAVASARVSLTPSILSAILEGSVTKGDVLGVARLAGIQAAKRTPELIPLAHPLAIHHVSVDFSTDQATGEIEIKATVCAFERTGVEMEAMVAASVAALTVYDMCKGSDKGISIEQVVLLEKDGGKSGSYRRRGAS
jgi:cyclic pyranopterin phosphate synthase